MGQIANDAKGATTVSLVFDPVSRRSNLRHFMQVKRPLYYFSLTKPHPFIRAKIIKRLLRLNGER